MPDFSDDEDGASGARGAATGVEEEIVEVGDYAPGVWTHRSRFLPTVSVPDADSAMGDQFRDAIEAGNLQAVRLLLHSGVPPDITIGEHGRSGLHLATLRNDALMCQLLLSFRANPLHQDLHPLTDCVRAPVDVARERDLLPILHMFNGVIKRSSGSSDGEYRAPLDLGPEPGLVCHAVRSRYV
mmetsp:Transcript_83962/g.166689  ORF Transcript_83962/g.166689 Transcript_83962/m.166689 type:complete len:184 (-) Transcript_83962:63-614(-)